ncbi:hypothetical protein R3P38DRAFT_3230780 [Favolaschia claudopus]|uniref:Uncharacterized protein n=1 Tax=Favolaschia claudopus TaxID=2862362 RepID=A0AAV9ZLS6_9AGAR
MNRRQPQTLSLCPEIAVTHPDLTPIHMVCFPSNDSKFLLNASLASIPSVLVAGTLLFLDKTAFNYANLFGFQPALKLHGNQFKVYFGNAVAQYPIQVVIGKYVCRSSISRLISSFFSDSYYEGFMCGLIVLTSKLSMSLIRIAAIVPQCTNFETVMINRFVLGMFEASTSPGLTLMTFYILGGVTMAWSIVILFFLPDSPASARFLKPEMRVLAAVPRPNTLAIKNKKFKKEQAWVAVKDIKIWILFSPVQ